MKLSSFILALTLTAITSATLLQPVRDFGDDPRHNAMYIYVPEKLAPNPAIVVALHGCVSTAIAYYYRLKDLPPAADENGFIVVYPGARNNFACWDITSNASLTHGGGSDSLSIVTMVRYTIDKYNADPRKVFAMGTSAGASMATVLAAAYPDIFSAVSAYSGLPFGCSRESPNPFLFTDQACSNGQVVRSGEEWAGEVRKAWPEYDGSYPPVQLWHGASDGTVSDVNLGELEKQWAAVFGIELAKKNNDTPATGYTQSVFGDGTQLEGYLAEDVGHLVPIQTTTMLKWFNLI